MTPRSSCPGGECTPLRGAANLWHCQINTLPQPPQVRGSCPSLSPRIFARNLFPGEIGSSGSPKIRYRLAGSVLGSRGGLLFASAEAQPSVIFLKSAIFPRLFASIWLAGPNSVPVSRQDSAGRGRRLSVFHPIRTENGPPQHW